MRLSCVRLNSPNEGEAGIFRLGVRQVLWVDIGSRGLTMDIRCGSRDE
jgi:hypothetical protein